MHPAHARLGAALSRAPGGILASHLERKKCASPSHDRVDTASASSLDHCFLAHGDGRRQNAFLSLRSDILARGNGSHPASGPLLDALRSRFRPGASGCSKWSTGLSPRPSACHRGNASRFALASSLSLLLQLGATSSLGALAHLYSLMYVISTPRVRRASCKACSKEKVPLSNF
jgi:hypothetical protein